ncbi:2OG-Fe(II) oxygenase [Streptomyces sp. TLI_105]|uniref:2OG-Fe(II) oxygenase n=1 Tax=Streptomyces sp. TLI_105 TaxID=1881019 RepID=UPI000898E396|nr:2OG-Fe(II) oxygenase [Streptomyces sp. TLI_105]SED17187.1 2OG-Fe(II) oxygenase superfamily protein [Streptomyces sp. TLI_105]
MNIVASGARYRVIDDFLPANELAEIRSLMKRRRFEEVASVIYPETDGHAFRSRGAVLRQDTGAPTAASREQDAQPAAFRTILGELGAHPDMFGVPGEDWSSVGFSFWQYPAGSRLGWHNDVATGRLGEFVFFLHEEWRASWAGELVILDADPEAVDVDTTGMSAMEAVEAKASMASHALTAIVPKPNRLVLVQEGTIHCINRVDPTAGTTLRQTMTGFVAGAAPEPGQRSVDRLTSLLGSA